MTPLKIETLHIQKTPNYENLHNSLIREVIEINTSDMKLCYDMTHALIDAQWSKMLNKKKGKNERITGS